MDDLEVNILSILEGHQKRGMLEGMLLICLLGSFKRFKSMSGWNLKEYRSDVRVVLERLKKTGKIKRQNNRWILTHEAKP